MTLVIRNSRELLDPKNLKLKILLIAFPGFGKTEFIGRCPNVGAGVCETGLGKGILSVASKGIDFVELNDYEDLAAFTSGAVFKDKDTLALDSLSDVAATHVKAKAIAIPRSKGGESVKRSLGIPELDDYGVMGELCRKELRKLIDQPKHIVVTSGVRIDKPDPENLQAETLIGPALPGQLFLGSTAMFDIVLFGRTRSKLADPRDAKSRYTERYWMTEGSGGYLAKNRLSIGKGSFLPSELIYDLEKDSGTFNDIFKRAQEAYANALKIG